MVWRNNKWNSWYKWKTIRKALEKSQIAKDVARVRGEVESKAKEIGKVSETALAEAKTKVSTAEAELKKATESLGKKFSKGGKAKWIAPVIGAAALGIGALMLRPKD